ncbi:MAG: O-antigen ligase family protein [Pararobbsia sp.]
MRAFLVFNWLVTAALFLAPTLVLILRGGSGYCYFALLALSLGAAFVHRRDRDFFSPFARYRWFTIAMLAFPCAIVVQQVIGQYYLPRQFEPMSRFLFALPIFLVLCRLPSRQLRALGWGCAAGSILAGGWAAMTVLQTGLTTTLRFSNTYTNPIPFGDTALLLAFMSIFTLGWDGARNGWATGVKVLGLVAGGYASYLSGTRGGWLAVPVFVVLLGAQYGWFTHWKRIVIAGTMIVVAGAVLMSTSLVEHRVADATTDIAQLQQGKVDTSVGLRLQLWKASWLLYTEHPVFGVGKGHLEQELDKLANRGIATREIVNERAHSDFFSTIAEMGTIGLACLLCVYIGWAVELWRAHRSPDAATCAASHAGLALVLSTMIYGLTIDVLVPLMNTTLLALLAAGLLAMIEARRREMAALEPMQRQASRRDDHPRGLRARGALS